MATSSRPDLFAYMDAYKVLGVEYSADASEIRRAHRRLARQHHPDRYPAGSAEQQIATARMAAVNDAYRLVHEAPLRFHRVSRAFDPDIAWEQSELDEAIRRGRAVRRVDLFMTIGLVAIAAIVVPMLLRSTFHLVPSSPARDLLVFVLTAASGLTMYAMLGPRMWHTLLKIQLTLAIVRLLTSNWSSFF